MEICVSHKANCAGANNWPVWKRTKKSSVLLSGELIVIIQRKGLKKGGQWSAFLRKENCDSQAVSSDFYLAWAKFSWEVKGNNELKISELCTAVPAKPILWANFCFHRDGYTLCRVLRVWTPRNKSSIFGCSGPCWTISTFLNIFLSMRQSYGLPLWPLPSACKSWGSKVNHTRLTDLQLSLETDLWL